MRKKCVFLLVIIPNNNCEKLIPILTQKTLSNQTVVKDVFERAERKQNGVSDFQDFA